MKSGAVIVDLSAEGGGNCEDTKPGETVEIGPVTIVAPLNVPSLLGADASELYAKNQYNLLALMLKDNVIKIDWEDEVLAKTASPMPARSRMTRPSRQQNRPPQPRSQQPSQSRKRRKPAKEIICYR